MCLIHVHIPTLWYFDTSVTYPQWFRRVKIVLPRFVWQQYLGNITMQPAVGCYNLWTNLRFRAARRYGKCCEREQRLERNFIDCLWKSYTKDRNGPSKPKAILVLNSNDMTSLLANALNTNSTVSGLYYSIGRKGQSYRVTLDGCEKYSEKLLGRKGPFRSFMQVLPKYGRKVHFNLLWIRIKLIFQWYKYSLSIIYYAYHFKFANQKQMLSESIDLLHKPHNAPVPYPTRHQYITEMYIILLQNHALWVISLMHCGIVDISVN